MKSPLDNIVVVLSHTTEPRNLGAAARALKTMGLRRLRLVNPRDHLGEEARAVAHGAEDILEAAELFDSMAAAVADVPVAAATTSRGRQLRKSAFLPPDELARRLVAHAADGPAAILFGTERTGLTNEEINLCRYLSRADLAQPQPSLNLGQAVMVYAWEVRRAWREARAAGEREIAAATGRRTGGGESPGRRAGGVDHPHRGTRLPTQYELDTMYAHFGAAMGAVGYTEAERRKFLTYLRHLHMRAGIVDWELQIFHLLARRILETAKEPPFGGLG